MSKSASCERPTILVYGADEGARGIIVRRLVDAGFARERIVDGAIGELGADAGRAASVIVVVRDGSEAARSMDALAREWPQDEDLPPLRTLALEARSSDAAVLSLKDVPSAWLRALVAADLEIERCRDDAARSKSELDRFLYVLSHDLLAPVRSVVGFAGLVQRRAAEGSLDPGLAKLLDIVQRAATRLQTMILGLREVSRVRTLAADLAEIRLAQVIAEVIAERRTEIERSSAVVEVGTLSDIRGDIQQIRALLDELLVNALIHVVEGESPNITIECETRGDLVDLRIADRGPAIPESEREWVFEPYHQLAAVDECEHPGTGLTLCRAIARRHGGELAIAENPGGGNVFVVTLPLATRKATPVLA